LRAAVEFVERQRPGGSREAGEPVPHDATLESVASQPISKPGREDSAVAPPEPTSSPAPINDPTPLHLDTPAADDRLNRRGFARSLAVRLERTWREMNPDGKARRDPDRHAPQGSFVLHLHGEWGSGKSSLLE